MFERFDQPVPGGSIAIERLGNPRAPTLLFAHANGMCAAIYRAFLAPLSARFDVLAYDARGHGATRLDTGPAADPSTVGHAVDMARLVAALRADGRIAGPLILGGHSLGGASAVRAAATWPALCDGLLLIDPATLPLARDRQQADEGPWLALHLGDRVARRRRHFPDRTAMADALRGRGVFAGWPDAALAAYVAAAAVPAPDGVVLACAPEWEARIFRSVVPGFFRLLAGLSIPVVACIGGISPLYGEAERAVLSATLGERLGILAGLDHFFPVTDPGPAADAALALADRFLPGQGARAAR